MRIATMQIEIRIGYLSNKTCSVTKRGNFRSSRLFLISHLAPCHTWFWIHTTRKARGSTPARCQQTDSHSRSACFRKRPEARVISLYVSPASTQLRQTTSISGTHDWQRNCASLSWPITLPTEYREAQNSGLTGAILNSVEIILRA
jgi:hypothetical protein